MAQQHPPRNGRKSPTTDLMVTVGLLQKDSVVRGQQLDLIVKKLDETVEKFHTLTLDVMKMLTTHTSQIQDLQTRVGDNAQDIEEQAKQLNDSKEAFLQAVREATKDLTTASQEEIKNSREEVKALETRVNKLELWKMWLSGALAVIGALSFFIDGPELLKRLFGS